jgi:protein-L-isoaspartate(D-aspartate) O-methyltransferase
MMQTHRVYQMICASLIVLCLGALSCARGQQEHTEDWQAERHAMVEMLVSRWNLADENVIRAMRETPRHLFVPEEVRPYAYVDTPLPIRHDQTISAPSIVALMTELLKPAEDHVILEVGTGSGYQAAVLAPLVKHVYTIEIVEPLAHSARSLLRELGYENVTVRAGDGYRGWAAHAPFDGIIVTCAPDRVPEPLVEQLKEGGRMVIPVGEQETGQELYVLTKEEGRIVQQSVLPVLFVPMTGEVQQQQRQ